MAADPKPEISVVLPCFRAAERAMVSVTELRPVLEAAAPGSWEIVVVDDGGRDFSSHPWKAEPAVRLLQLPHNAGKGRAIKTGMLKASGHARVYTDVDLPYGPELIPVIADLLLRESFHLVIGDRRLPTSRYREEMGPVRRWLSAAGTFFIGTLVTGGFFDTQCGLKGVRGDVADLLVPRLTIERFAFDVELVYLALRHNCDIKRIPVELRADREPSTVRPLRDALQAARDVFGIKIRALRGDYDCPPLARLLDAEFRSRIGARGSAGTRDPVGGAQGG